MNYYRIKTLGLAAVVATSVMVPLAYAAGMFPGYPIVGSAAFCNSTNSQSTSNTVPGTLPSNSNCTTTVPAGPTTLTGAEAVPADTGLPNGVAPQTVRIPTPMVASGAYSSSVPTTGSTVTVAANITNYLAIPAGSLNDLAITFPPNPIDGQIFRFASTQTITNLTLAGGTGSATIDSAPTTLTRSTTIGTMGAEYLYKSSANKWYRLF